MATHPSQQTAASRPDQSAHAPGPYGVAESKSTGPENECNWYVHAPGQGYGGRVIVASGLTEANAKFYAAAPDMLAALTRLDQIINDRCELEIGFNNGDWVDAIEGVRAAIAKAEGR